MAGSAVCCPTRSPPVSSSRTRSPPGLGSREEAAEARLRPSTPRCQPGAVISELRDRAPPPPTHNPLALTHQAFQPHTHIQRLIGGRLIRALKDLHPTLPCTPSATGPHRARWLGTHHCVTLGRREGSTSAFRAHVAPSSQLLGKEEERGADLQGLETVLGRRGWGRWLRLSAAFLRVGAGPHMLIAGTSQGSWRRPCQAHPQALRCRIEATQAR